MKIFPIFVMNIFCITIIILFIKSYIEQKKQINHLISNGKTATATIIDYIKFRIYDTQSNLEFFYYPILEIHKENESFIHIYCNNNGIRSTTFVKKDYPIGSEVKIYYIDSDEDIIQLNWKDKIFLNKHYPKLGIVEDKNIFIVSLFDQKITFESKKTYENRYT